MVYRIFIFIVSLVVMNLSIWVNRVIIFILKVGKLRIGEVMLFKIIKNLVDVRF